MDAFRWSSEVNIPATKTIVEPPRNLGLIVSSIETKPPTIAIS